MAFFPCTNKSGAEKADYIQDSKRPHSNGYWHGTTNSFLCFSLTRMVPTIIFISKKEEFLVDAEFCMAFKLWNEAHFLEELCSSMC